MISRDLVLNAAKTFIGKPYVWGGESDAEGGYDCSGFVYAVLNKAGIKVGRLTAQGYYNKYSTYIHSSGSSIQGGDLLFFGKSQKAITHIAIAKDYNSMYESIGSSKNTKTNPGKGVTLSSIKRRSDLIAAINIYNDTDIYYPIYQGTSKKIDVVFGAIGAPYGNVTKRKPVATANGITNYKGTATQNLKLISIAKKGELKRPH